MTFQIAFLLGVLAIMMVLFVTEKLPVELTAFLGLSALTLHNYLTPEEAFSGFSSPAAITMLSIFIVSTALNRTGVADTLARHIHARVGTREVAVLIAVMAIAAAVGAFMPNIAATAMLLPAVASLAQRCGIAPSRLFMPLAFAAIFGGTTTLVGTPRNLIASHALQQNGFAPFELFDFTPLGLAFTTLGIVYLATIGRRLLPKTTHGSSADRRADLTRVYRIHERLFSIKIPENSPLAGRSLRDARLGHTLGVTVVEILRDGRKQLAPGTDEVLRGGDVLLVAGRFNELKDLLKAQGIQLDAAAPPDLGEAALRFSGARLRIVPGSELIGKTLRQLAFRERFGVAVAAIRRNGALVRERLAHQELREGDEILALGSHTHIELLEGRQDLDVVESGPSAVESLRQCVTLLNVPQGSPLAGTSIGSSSFWDLVGMAVIGMVRKGRTLLTLSQDRVIEEGDQLLVAGAPARVMSLLQVGHLEVAEGASSSSALESEEIGIVEAVIAPRSQLAGKTIGELSFRSRFGVQVLAIWREGHPIRSGLADLEIRFGDALLLQGPKDRIRMLTAEPDFVILAPEAMTPLRREKAPVTMMALLLMILLVVTGRFPIQVAAFVAATLVLVFRVLSMEEAYRSIEWRALFLVAALLPVGIAMEHTGAARLLADLVTGAAGHLGPYGVLASILILTSVLSQSLDGYAAVVLVAPIALQSASQMSINPYTLMMGVALASSITFMTPFSGKANLLVMAAGGYRFSDYVKVGTPLTILLLVLLTVLVPIFYPFYAVSG